MKIDLRKVKYGKLGHFRFKKVFDKIIITNEIGWYCILSEGDFQDFIEGKISKSSSIYNDIFEKGFIRNEKATLKIALAYAKKNHFLFRGPSLHIFILTARCNNKCIYCHASAHDMSENGLDMTIETAEKLLQIAFESPNKAMTIEFQGGEPLVNWDVLKFITERAFELNKKKKKDLEIRLVTNLNLMTKDKLKYLISKRVRVTSSLDGPKHLHDRNRPLVNKGEALFGSSYENVLYWIQYFNKQLTSLSKNDHSRRMSTLATTTKYSLDSAVEIVDEYVGLGMEMIRIAPMNPFGFSKKAWNKIGYSADEFVFFYKQVLDYILELNKKNVFVAELTAVFYLKKILAEYDPNMFEMRSPCGAGIGQISYNYDGRIYTCDDGRMIGEMNDDTFLLGNADETYEILIDNATTKSMCSASCLIGSPGCEDCAYLPYCGTCPVYNYSEQGNILGQMPTNERCKISKAMLDFLFEKMQDNENVEIFRKWILIK